MGAKVREFMTHWDAPGPIWYERDEDELVGTQRSGGRPMPRIRVFDVLQGPTNRPGFTPPVVWKGAVYFGSGDGNVYALDAATGKLNWKFKTGDVVHASPAVANGTVYVGSWDRNLYALDAATGALKWRFETGDDREVYNQIGIASSAAVMDGTVFVGCRDGQFYAVDGATGALKWKHDNNKGWTIASPSVGSGRVYFPTSDGTKFWALDAATVDVLVFARVVDAVQAPI